MPSVAIASSEAGVPPKAVNSYRFSLFNALNFQITCGAPMVLYAKALGGSATIIGLVAALAPLMTVLQLPTAYFIPKIGYKGFVLLGWTSRAIMLFLLALLPLISFLDPPTQIALMLGSLCVFTILRGVSTGAWLPWLTALVPEAARSTFLRFDQVSMQCGGVLAIAISTLVLWSGAERWQFALLFFISACAGTLSLYFIRKIPDIEIGEQTKTSSQPVPWVAMMKHPPFLRLVIFNVVYNSIVGGLMAFVIGYLQGKGGYTAGQILAMTLCSAVGAFASVPFFGRVLERTGSKPLLRLSLTLYTWGILFWILVSSGTVPAMYQLVAFNYLVLGIAGGLFSIANTRIAMDTMPVMGRNHFFSLFTVFTSLSLGISPIFWGIFLDAIGNHEFAIGFFQVTRYSSYFILLAVLAFLTFFLANPLVEKRGAPFESAVRDVVIQARLQLYGRFIRR
jgi:MFS family permease